MPAALQCAAPPALLWSATRGMYNPAAGSAATGNYQTVEQYSCTPALDAVGQCSTAPDMETCAAAVRVNLVGACLVATLEEHMSKEQVGQPPGGGDILVALQHI